MKAILEQKAPEPTLVPENAAFSKELAEFVEQAERPKESVRQALPQRHDQPASAREPYGWD